MPSNRRIVALAVIALAVAFLVPSASTASSKKRQLDSVTYATSFGSFGRDAFVYVAIAKGYFAAEGLDVKVVPGLGTDNGRLLAAGQIDYSAGDVPGAASTIASQAYPIRAVAVTSQATGSAVAVLANSGINTPKDLAGKTFGDTPASTGHIFFNFWAKKVGLDPSTVTWVPTTPQTGPSLLASGRVSALGQFTVGAPLLEAATGQAIRMFALRTALPGLLGNALWTTVDRIQSNPDQVRRFTRALLKGLNWSIQHPADAGAIMKTYVPLVDPVEAGQELALLKPLVVTPCTKKYGVGYIDVGKMKSTASWVNVAFHPTTPLSYTSLYQPGFVKTATCTLK